MYSDGTASETQPLTSGTTTTITEYESISAYIDDCYYGDSQPLSNTFFMWRMWALFTIFLSAAGSGKANMFSCILTFALSLSLFTSGNAFSTTVVFVLPTLNQHYHDCHNMYLTVNHLLLGLMVIYNVEAVAEALGVSVNIFFEIKT